MSVYEFAKSYPMLGTISNLRYTTPGLLRKHRMLGYIESPYTVEKKYEAQRANHREVGELRSPQNGSRGRYIALMLYSLDGEQIGDHLLMYKGGAGKHLDSDWNRVVTEPDVKLDDLKFSERIVAHHVGYGRDGSVIMY